MHSAQVLAEVERKVEQGLTQAAMASVGQVEQQAATCGAELQRTKDWVQQRALQSVHELMRAQSSVTREVAALHSSVRAAAQLVVQQAAIASSARQSCERAKASAEHGRVDAALGMRVEALEAQVRLLERELAQRAQDAEALRQRVDADARWRLACTAASVAALMWVGYQLKAVRSLYKELKAASTAQCGTAPAAAQLGSTSPPGAPCKQLPAEPTAGDAEPPADQDVRA